MRQLLPNGTVIDSNAPASPTPASSVVSETAFGQASAVGSSANYARQDHTHGTPTTPTKTTVGLGNVDNTSDANKPVSTAQQTALNAKAGTGTTNTFSAVQTFSVGGVFGAQLGGYVTSGNHRVQIVASGTMTPLMIQGGSGSVEVWKDTAPTKAASFGMAVPGSSVGDDFVFSTFSSTPSAAWTERMRVTNAGSVIIGTGALTTTATDGFLYLPTTAGAPAGTPTTYTGRVPLVYDTANHRLYVYAGGTWRNVAF